MLRRLRRWGWSLWHRADASLTAAFVAECEAFLLGHYAEEATLRSGRAPDWAWMNLLVHGGMEELKYEFENGRSSTDEWRDARSFLAGRLLEIAADCGPLEEIQRKVLAPIELSLISNARVRLRSRWWMGTVLSALDRHRRMSRTDGQSRDCDRSP